jgi:hypothetical protein
MACPPRSARASGPSGRFSGLRGHLYPSSGALIARFRKLTERLAAFSERLRWTDTLSVYPMACPPRSARASGPSGRFSGLRGHLYPSAGALIARFRKLTERLAVFSERLR